MICPNCKTENSEGAKFCAKCGNALKQTTVPDQNAVGQLTPQIPPTPVLGVSTVGSTPVESKQVKKNYMNGYLSTGVLLTLAVNTGIIKAIFKSDDAVGFFVLVAVILIIIGVVKMLKQWFKDRKK